MRTWTYTRPMSEADLVHEAFEQETLGMLSMFFEGSIDNPALAKGRLLKGMAIAREARDTALAALATEPQTKKGKGISGKGK
jgi:hypothetical protein